MLDEKCMNRIVFIGASFSILSRLGFGVVIYRNKSRNSISLSICILNIVSNSFWIPYAIQSKSSPLFVRSVADIIISFISMLYIANNIKRHIIHRDELLS